MNIAIICGGAGAERGISINSARSILDHLQSEKITVTPYYFDVFMNVYALSPYQLYSNTPSDFDFKLKDNAQKISRLAFIEQLKKHDLTFPLIHGIFGEDGQLQALLEENDIPYIGGTAEAYARAFPKDAAYDALKKNGFFTLPYVVVDLGDLAAARETVAAFFKAQGLEKAVIKPTLGGSSIGTYVIKNADDAVAALQQVIDQKLYVGTPFIVEPFCSGREFSTAVVQNKRGEAVALVPTEIEVVKGLELFDYRKKYLPTDSTVLHCPPRFSGAQIEAIQKGSEKIFNLFGFRDFARIDGWVLDDGTLMFSDINPVSGLEQNSFFFKQAATLGFTHKTLLRCIVSNACRRHKIQDPETAQGAPGRKKKKVFVLMGGKTAERQVSLMSGTNIWLKLRRSTAFEPTPFLMDKEGFVWRLPYAFALNHTVEEIRLMCEGAQEINAKLEPLSGRIYKKLGLPNAFSVERNTPRRMTLDAFCAEAEESDAFVFIGLHGGEGEDGRLQKKLESFDLLYSGSDSAASRLCMDKFETGRLVNGMNDPEIGSLPKKQFNVQTASAKDIEAIWKDVTAFKAESFAVKPLSDGCSSGIVRLYTLDDFKRYVSLAAAVENDVIPAGSFRNQDNEIALPQDKNPLYIVEPFVQVDYLRVINDDIVHKQKSGWLEFTVGVLEKFGKYHALNPSITVAEGEVLSLEEKFQGGTGVNITPPPESILKPEFRQKIKTGIEKIAATLGIKSYARIDIFFNVLTGKMVVIEANSLPGLTPSTVIYHQALMEEPPLPPRAFLERIINDKMDVAYGAGSGGTGQNGLCFAAEAKSV